jgi:hypothetical protein
MSDKYILKEVHIELQPGVKLVAEISSLEALQSLLTELKSKNLSAVLKKEFKQEKEEGKKETDTLPDTPAARVEVNAELAKGSLLKSNVLAFKDGVPQLLRPGVFKTVVEASLILLHAVETGLRTSALEYDNFKALYEAQNIKSGTPLAMLMTNLRNSGYLDKKEYHQSRKLRLTPKGDRKAIEILKTVVSQ